VPHIKLDQNGPISLRLELSVVFCHWQSFDTITKACRNAVAPIEFNAMESEILSCLARQEGTDDSESDSESEANIPHPQVRRR